MTQDPKQSGSIGFDFIKSNYFRVIHADGAWGGIGPHGHIQMAVYSDRFPIPKRVDFEVQDGRLGDEISRESREGIVREIEAEIIMSIETAIQFRDWLSTKIEQAGA